MARPAPPHPRRAPCAGLDPVAREEFLRYVEALARRRGGPALVLVTHHVEEITPAFTHVLLLRQGSIFAAGPKARAVTTRALSGVFGARVSVRGQKGRYQASVTATPLRSGAAARRFR